MRFLFFLSLFLFPFWTFAQFETQWFTEYNWVGSPFRCESTCFISLGKATGDVLDLGVKTSGNGIIAYGHLFNGQIIPAWSSQLAGQDISMSPPGSLWADPLFGQKKDLPVIIIFQWNITWEIRVLWFHKSSFSQRFISWFIAFWKIDPFGPATINLLQWPRIPSQNANAILYVIFIIGSIGIILSVKKHNKWKYIGVFWLLLWFLYDIRMSSEILYNYTKDIVYFSQEDYPFRDRGDFYKFVDFTDKSLEKNNIPEFSNVSFFGDPAYWYSQSSMKYFLYPHRTLYNTPTDVIIAYKPLNFSLSKEGLSYSGILLWTGSMEQFSPDAFIFYIKK